MNKPIEFDKNMIIIIAICLVITMCGFFTWNIDFIPLYIFGVIFFFAGLFIALYIKYFGLIFLFSHGVIGFMLMIGSLMGHSKGNSLDLLLPNDHPLLTDGGIPTNIKVYLAVTIGFFISAFIFTIVHNLSSKMKKDKKFTIYILSLYLIVVVLAMLFPKFFSYLYK